MIMLSQLAEPFPEQDIEWRVSRAGMGQRGIYCYVLAYITARAIQNRLDEVVGPEKWQVTEPRSIDVGGHPAYAVGISIRVGEEWVTKWDVAEPTNYEPAKGGFSGAMKRAGAQWGIGRYLYYLDETFAEVSEADPATRGWHWAKLSPQHGGATYYWKPPALPGWAVPKDPEHEVTLEQLNDLKRAWRDTFGAGMRNPAELREGFARFVGSVVGEFPIADHACWTRDALDQCVQRVAETTDPDGPSADVPFEE